MYFTSVTSLVLSITLLFTGAFAFPTPQDVCGTGVQNPNLTPYGKCMSACANPDVAYVSCSSSPT